MDAQDNKKLALQKAISAHEQAAAALNDVSSILDDVRYRDMVARIDQNIAQLHSESETSEPEDRT